MKKLILFTMLLLVFAANLPAKSYKFVAMDRYYNKAVPIDSIVVRDMKSGEDKTYFADSIYLETITSVEDISANSGFEIYPNPVEDVLNLTLPISNNSPIIITDIAGRIHFKKDIANQKISLNVAGLPTGIYNISYGNGNRRFVKSSAANGSEVTVISSENRYKSLIKENETQSQFDYKFTVYCSGFKPNVFETEALSIDSTITLDMASRPSSFDGKHIKVELYLNRLYVVHTNYDHNWISETIKEYIEYKYSRLDTFVVRGNKCKINNIKLLEDANHWDESYNKDLIEFEIDINKMTLNNFSLVMDYREAEVYGSRYSDEKNYLLFKIENEPLDLESQIYLNNIEFEFRISKNYSFTEGSGCGGHSIMYSYGAFNSLGSYIKIEIID